MFDRAVNVKIKVIFEYEIENEYSGPFSRFKYNFMEHKLRIFSHFNGDPVLLKDYSVKGAMYDS